MNIDLLTNTLEVTENPGLDTLDPRFMDIAGLVESGDYLGAATQAEEILEEGVYDIRIIGYFLYGAFLEQGVGAVTAILGCMTSLLTENWDALGPATNREKHAQTSLNWFLRQLVKKLQYEEGKKSEVWEEWVAEVSSDDVQETLDTSEELQGALGSALEDQAGPVLEGLSKANDWLRTFQQFVYREPELETEPEGEPEPAPAGAEAREMTPSALAADAVSAEGSYHLKLLLRKMGVFERLVEDEEFARAAIVADDINQIIANFDPRIYFPKIFSKYSLLLALNIEKVAAFEENKGSVEWQTMQDLYKVDLDSFVSLDAEITYSSSPAEQADYEEDEEGEEYEDEEEMYGEPDESEEDEYD
jgi:hypothetical protein